jgi:hypothetical protein
MYYIGLDLHKQTISYYVKDVANRLYLEGKIGSTRRPLEPGYGLSRSLGHGGEEMRAHPNAENQHFPDSRGYFEIHVIGYRLHPLSLPDILYQPIVSLARRVKI